MSRRAQRTARTGEGSRKRDDARGGTPAQQSGSEPQGARRQRENRIGSGSRICRTIRVRRPSRPAVRAPYASFSGCPREGDQDSAMTNARRFSLLATATAVAIAMGGCASDGNDPEATPTPPRVRVRPPRPPLPRRRNPTAKSHQGGVRVLRQYYDVRTVVKTRRRSGGRVASAHSRAESVHERAQARPPPDGHDEGRRARRQVGQPRQSDRRRARSRRFRSTSVST